MKKRVLLIFSVLSLYSIVLSGCSQKVLTSGNTQQTGNPDIYIQLYSVRDDIKTDFNSTIKGVADIGYTGVEAAGYNDGKFYNLSPIDFKKEIEDSGMKVLSSHAGKSLSKEPSKTNWEPIWEWWDKAIAAHKSAGMKYLITASMPKPDNIADLQVYCDYYNEIGRRCKEQGIRFGYHNHSFEFVEIGNKLMYDYMIENTNPEYVFFQMDVYWVVRGGKSPVEYFKRYPGRFEVLHIKDEKELGESGMVGFDAIFKNTAIAGTKYIVVEIERYNFPPLQSLKLGYDYLKGIL